MTIRTRLFLGFTVMLFIFIIDGIINYKLSLEVIRNMNYLSNSETIIRNSSMLHKSMIEMQSGFRGYLLTGQESFLQNYYDGLKEIPPIIEGQKPLLSKGSQKNRLTTIIDKHYQWIDYANSLITTKRDTLPEANQKYQELFEKKLKMEVGKKLNDEIKRMFIQFDAYEYAVRHKRKAILQHSIEKTRKTTQLLTGISIILAIFAGFYITSIITTRIKKLVVFAEQISKGNFRTIKDKKNDELRKLSDSLNLMSQTLDKNFKSLTQKNIDLDQFAYVVSHDLKAPLRGVDNLIKWTEEDYAQDLVPGVKKNIELIKGRINRLENMINGLLDYARIGRTKTQNTEVDLKILLEEIVEIIVPSTFTVNIKNMPTFYTKKLNLEQVFSNLLSNAVKYSAKNNGQIIIDCRDIGEQYEFSVSDDGPGIDPQYHEKIFQIFQTLRERDAFESTGIGLSIVKKIIEEQKGTIKVISKPNNGTTFIFTWPKESITENLS